MKPWSLCGSMMVRPERPLRLRGVSGAKRSAISSGSGVSAASRSLNVFDRMTVPDWLSADGPMKPSYASHERELQTVVLRQLLLSLRVLFHSTKARNRSARSESDIGDPLVRDACSMNASKLLREAVFVTPLARSEERRVGKEGSAGWLACDAAKNV